MMLILFMNEGSGELRVSRALFYVSGLVLFPWMITGSVV